MVPLGREGKIHFGTIKTILFKYKEGLRIAIVVKINRNSHVAWAQIFLYKALVLLSIETGPMY